MAVQPSYLARENRQKPINRNKVSKSNARRSRRGGIAQIFRGILLEGMGALALVFLYLTVQVSSEKINAATTGWERSPRSEIQRYSIGQTAGYDASYSTAFEYNRPLPIEKPVWSTWREIQNR